MRAQDRVVIAWCDPGTTDGGFTATLARLALARGDRLADQAFIRMVGSGLLSRTRNQLVATFLDRTDADWLLMVDADQQIPVEAFDRLTDAASYRDRPVLAGLVFGAYPNDGLYPTPRPSIFRLTEHGFTPVLDYPAGRVVPIDAAGTGCLMVHRAVLEAIRESTPHLRDWCWFQDGPNERGAWQSEDITFCTRITAAGFPIHAHCGAVLPHHKTYWQTEDHFKAWKAAT